ncbi:solute carrier family 25 (mitochondrial adenine nucleotide translocator), member 4/5/6/31 [Angomonas deanei]|uniref:Mitochondrial carrier protein, putative n=1 Tax=Angomonas deanei TaxID=59799 RepID=A0A7G2CQL7_9TRYP|nr:solute carrier family 25 (mitochondrial adenine nucleotide translocator), member 4/5/6/31 [Angomonas deanei]CAD2222108.1 Mitochondrial carrier protein, putative [Angomonas deanei]|eukprot:EPY40324.1 solute carrier family 25 (mitochondrial adenine nucleotide translocator), member 4/5/6/31 [Angomonas deanei]
MSQDNAHLSSTAAYVQQLWVLRAVNRTILAPLDRVKYVMVCQRELQRLGTLRVDLPNTASCIRHLRQLEGGRSFWRGNLVQVVSLLPITLAQLFIGPSAHSFFYHLIPNSSGSPFLCTLAEYTAFIGAALAVAVITYPLDFVRFRLAVDLKAYKGAPYEFRHALSFFSHPVLNDCPHFLYRGLTLFILGSIFFGSIRSTLLDVVGPYLPPEKGEQDWRAIMIQTTAGMTIAGVATLCLHPVDLVRRRVMTTVTEDRLRYRSSWECALRIAKKEGWQGFYRGWGITLGRVVVGTGLMLLSLPN